MAVKKIYMCGIDFQHELGETEIRVFASVEALKKKKKCWQQCGIVELSLNLNKAIWIFDQDLFGNKNGG